MAAIAEPWPQEGQIVIASVYHAATDGNQEGQNLGKQVDICLKHEWHSSVRSEIARTRFPREIEASWTADSDQNSEWPLNANLNMSRRTICLLYWVQEGHINFNHRR
jgi:hypothetical protein